MNLALRPLHIAGLTAAAFAAVAGFWLLWHFDPSAPGSRFPACMFRSLTGYYCIGCGMTRMLHALVQEVLDSERPPADAAQIEHGLTRG